MDGLEDQIKQMQSVLYELMNLNHEIASKLQERGVDAEIVEAFNRQIEGAPITHATFKYKHSMRNIGKYLGVPLVYRMSVDSISRDPKLTCGQCNISVTLSHHFSDLEALNFLDHLTCATFASREVGLMLPQNSNHSICSDDAFMMLDRKSTHAPIQVRQVIDRRIFLKCFYGVV
jgi:hypothetical protein